MSEIGNMRPHCFNIHLAQPRLLPQDGQDGQDRGYLTGKEDERLEWVSLVRSFGFCANSQ